MHKEAKCNCVKLQNEFQRDVPIVCFNDILSLLSSTLSCVSVGGGMKATKEKKGKRHKMSLKDKKA